jgi:SAM-dependent methyltransferase
MTDPYERLSDLYDAMASDPGLQAFYYEWADALEAAVKRYRVRGRVLVDIACGTGNTALPWVEKGWTVVGVDRSEAMLREARKKSSRVRWYRQELTELNIEERADVVTCHFDSLNHVLDARGLQKIFVNVGGVLTQGGVFQFDLSTDRLLRWLATSEKLFRVGDSYFTACNEYDRRRRVATFHQLWFVKKGRLYERREITLQERAYETADVRRMLLRAGMRLLSARVQRRLKGKPARIVYLARKG